MPSRRRCRRCAPRLLRFDAATVDAQLDGATGVVLAGGGDVDPAEYGGDPALARGIDRQRDSFELALVRRARARCDTDALHLPWPASRQRRLRRNARRRYRNVVRYPNRPPASGARRRDDGARTHTGPCGCHRARYVARANRRAHGRWTPDPGITKPSERWPPICTLSDRLLTASSKPLKHALRPRSGWAFSGILNPRVMPIEARVARFSPPLSPRQTASFLTER